MATATGHKSANRKYELVVILHPDVTEADQKAFFKKNQEIIQTYKGALNHLDTWGKRKLANPIQKIARGTYFHMTFEAQGEAIAELERTMRINDKVLRFKHSRLDDRISLAKFVEEFKESLAETANREKEREVKIQQRRAAAAGGMGPGGGPGHGGSAHSGRRDRGDMKPSRTS